MVLDSPFPGPGRAMPTFRIHVVCDGNRIGYGHTMTDMTQTPSRPTAAMIAIGDELLCGRTHDTNIHHMAKWLDERGVELVEARLIPDRTASIVGSVNDLRHRADYLFTSGGIGPTHDDITADALGEAFGLAVEENPAALAMLKEWYLERGEEITDRRRRMARTPSGARLIANSVSGAPGFIIENTYVMAGVPAIFTAMLETLDEEIARGPVYAAYTVYGDALESEIADGLLALEEALKGLKIGSYPGVSGKPDGLAIVCKAFDPALAKKAATAVEGLLRAQGSPATLVEGFGPERI
ncbi:MAG: competence/damage-inducible protein A [Parvularcula sp.]